MRGEGKALPWVDPIAFARRAIALCLDDLAKAQRFDGWVFFDRGLIDAAVALEHLTGEPAIQTLGAQLRYHRRVFLAPPWPEIFTRDQERRHDLAAAIAEYDRLARAYAALGYEVEILPKAAVQARVDSLLATLRRD